MSELKPCPFCGGEARLADNTASRQNGVAWVFCRMRGCPGSGDEQDTAAEAIVAWNTRQPDPAVLVEALWDIGIYGCGMLSQPVGLNCPPDVWMAKRIARMEEVARAALAAVEKNDAN